MVLAHPFVFIRHRPKDTAGHRFLKVLCHNMKTTLRSTLPATGANTLLTNGCD
jgi:hypothetical protein